MSHLCPVVGLHDIATCAMLVDMYIAAVPNRGSPPAQLVRESYREGGKVKTRTLANVSKLPPEAIEVLRQVLKGEKLVPVEQAFEIVEDGSRQHGHVAAVLSAMKRLDFERLIASRRSRQRDLVVAMVVARILQSESSKLSTPLWWSDTTLPETLDIADCDEDHLYEAMDWVLERQGRIEKKLASRHLEDDGLALFDLTSSYFEGESCPLAALGHSRDGKKGKLQVNYGLLTNRQGIPVSVSVFRGNTGDPKTLLPQVERIRSEFSIERFVLVGDRGMLTQKQIDSLQDMDGIDWIGALRPDAIKKLVEGGAVQFGLFDDRNLFEVTHPDFPGERLVACRNGDLAQRRRDKRASLLEATAKELDKIRQMVRRGRLHGEDVIGARVHKVLSGYRLGQHVHVQVRHDGFDYEVDEDAVAAEVALQASDNPELKSKLLARSRRHIEAIAKKLDKIRHRTERGRLYGKDRIGIRVGKVVNKYRVAKHFKLEIRDDDFEYEIDEEKVAAEAALDGIYVIRTSLSESRMNAEETVRSYKLLSQVERAFRAFKSIDLRVRPIRHRLEDRVRAHIFLCTLAYYVHWHMVDAWRTLLYCDENQESKASRDPVAPAERSDGAKSKARTKRLDDGSRVHDFHSLLGHLGTIVRNTCRCPGVGPDAPVFTIDTTPNPKQRTAFDLLRKIRV